MKTGTSYELSYSICWSMGKECKGHANCSGCLILCRL